MINHTMLSQEISGKQFRSKPKKPEWVIKGLYFAGDCFRCANKLEYETIGLKVKILCRNNCNYQPLEPTLTQ